MFAPTKPTPEYGHQLLRRESNAKEAGQDSAIAGRLTGCEVDDILEVVRRVARVAKLVTWEMIYSALRPDMRDRLGSTSVGGGIMTKACRLGIVKATDRTQPATHEASHGRRCLIYESLVYGT